MAFWSGPDLNRNQVRTQSFQEDIVVHGVGRVPDIEDLHLEKAGIKTEKGAFAVDKQIRTSNPLIYAGGDCASAGMQLTPVAVLQGEVAAANILNENSVEEAGTQAGEQERSLRLQR